jgi:serine/threonine protein kinase
MSSHAHIDRQTAEALLGGRFTIREELGRGGQGVVYRATRTRDVEGAPAVDDVALKIHTDPKQDERIAREIEVMQRLRYPCLANLVEHGQFTSNGDDLRFIAWEFISGEPLSTRLQRGPITPKLAATVGRDVATALVHIWGERIVHRDVNPKNVMLRTGDRDAVLIDLGAARHLTQSALTTVGYAWGTVGFMSPEQARGETQLTCYSDVFTLGLTLVDALQGRPATAQRQYVIQTGRLRASDLVPTAPGKLTQLLDRMLAPRAVHRPTPGVVVDQLSALLPLL